MQSKLDDVQSPPMRRHGGEWSFGDGRKSRQSLIEEFGVPGIWDTVSSLP
jgi:hypothetical protein